MELTWSPSIPSPKASSEPRSTESMSGFVVVLWVLFCFKFFSCPHTSQQSGLNFTQPHDIAHSGSAGG